MKRSDFGVGEKRSSRTDEKSFISFGSDGSAVPSVDGSFRRLYDDGQVWRGSDG